MGEAKGCVHVAHRWTSSLLRIGWWRGKKNKRPLIVQPVPKREIEFVFFVSVVCYIVYIRFCGFSSDPEINAMRFVVVFERSDLVSFHSFCEILPPPVVDGINVIHNSLLFWLEIFLVSLYYIFCVGFCSLYSTFGFWSIQRRIKKKTKRNGGILNWEEGTMMILARPSVPSLINQKCLRENNWFALKLAHQGGLQRFDYSLDFHHSKLCY